MSADHGIGIRKSHFGCRQIPYTSVFDNKLIISSFLDTCRMPQFQKHWMTAETWLDIIAYHFKLPPEVNYNVKQLKNAVR